MEVSTIKTLTTGPTATVSRQQLEGDFLKIENVPSGNTLSVKTSEGETFIGSTGRSVKFEKEYKYLEISGYVAGEVLTIQTGYGWILDSLAEAEITAVIPNPLPVTVDNTVNVNVETPDPLPVEGVQYGYPVSVEDINYLETLDLSGGEKLIGPNAQTSGPFQAVQFMRVSVINPSGGRWDGQLTMTVADNNGPVDTPPVYDTQGNKLTWPISNNLTGPSLDLIVLCEGASYYSAQIIGGTVAPGAAQYIAVQKATLPQLKDSINVSIEAGSALGTFTLVPAPGTGLKIRLKSANINGYFAPSAITNQYITIKIIGSLTANIYGRLDLFLQTGGNVSFSQDFPFSEGALLTANEALQIVISSDTSLPSNNAIIGNAVWSLENA